MKKLIIPLLLGGLIFSTGVKTASAQNQGPENKMEIAKKVSGSFNKLSQNAIAPQWFAVNKRFMVHYTENDRRNKAIFTKAGTLVYHLMYGSEEEMPKNLRALVKSNYFDHAITSAVNVHANDSNHVWVVNVENDQEILVLRVEDGALSVIQKITKV